MQCSISECRFKAVKTVRIGFREKRNLCKNHYTLFMDKDVKHPSSFIRASDRLHENTIEKFNND